MLSFDMLGLKELYEIQLRATYDLEVAGVKIAKGEPIATFESVQFGNIDEIKEHVHARGGKNNPALITWSTTREINFNFTQGIFSRFHLALLGNSDIIKNQTILVPRIENVEVGDSLSIELRFTPSSLFIYDEDGSRIIDFLQENNMIIFNDDMLYRNLRIVYEFEYNEGGETIVVGQRLIDGYMELWGKTRLKDDRTGKTITGVIKIPRLKLMSDLSMRLGKDATPVVANFRATGFPTGSRGNERVLELVLLNDDIDSDI